MSYKHDKFKELMSFTKSYYHDYYWADFFPPTPGADPHIFFLGGGGERGSDP